MTISYIILDENAVPPERATSGSAGHDLRACIGGQITLHPHERALITTGIAVAIPEGYVGLVFGRSGLGTKHGVTLSNGVGVIDSDYRGQIHVGLVNHSDMPYTISNGDRIAQLCIMPAMAADFVQTDALDETGRSANGFGSTGK